ncbi:hypothetical protein ACFY00_04935 [Kitasatospora sp. NPDC001540]|uniref:hypothetical protein n=1 Tax=Kitasatospora sp. NPDC001540 TaxID=3364014 RepID=UPI0036A43816
MTLAIPSANAAGSTDTHPCAARVICTEHHGTSSPPATGGGGTSGGGGGGGSSTCTWNQQVVPCYVPQWGWFSEGCYYQESNPQPLPGEEAWGGHSEKDGAIYDSACITNTNEIQPFGQTFLAQAPGARPKKTPEEVAFDALMKIEVGEPVLHAAPAGDAVVGSPVWLWIDPDKGVVGPLSKELTEDGITVTTTVTLAEVEWTVDDGQGEKKVQSFTCKDAGVPYRPNGSPTCSHVFTQSSARMQDHAYSLSATLKWHVTARTRDNTDINMIAYDWTPTYTQAVLRVPVNEVQVLN